MKDKIRVGGFFSGIGAHVSACEHLKDRADFEYVFQCEFDPKTALAHDTIHGPIPNLGDITTVHDIGGDLQVDILYWTPPCIRKGDLVLTSDGYIPIEDVREGDTVLSHDGGWHNVDWAGRTGHKEIIGIKASCGLEIGATYDHRFYTRKMSRIQGKRTFSDAEWVCASDLTTTHYLGFPIGDEKPIPEWDGITMEWSDGRKPLHRNEISGYIGTEQFWWSVGRYIADGWVREDRGTVIIAVGQNKVDHIGRIFPMFTSDANREGSVFKVHINRKEIGAFCKQFGIGALNKHIPEKYMHLPKHLARALVDGYMAGDGSSDKHGIKCNTVSIRLALDLVRLIGYAYERPAHISKTEVKEYTVIEGRTVHQNPNYEVYFHPEQRAQDQSFYEDGWIWTPIKRMRTLDEEDVYDLTVADAHSFIVNGITVHNCQDISVQGKGAGNTKGSGTRSSLAYEVPRILANTRERERGRNTWSWRRCR